MIQLTDCAKQYLSDVVSNSQEPIAGILITVEKGGCSGMQYRFELVKEIKSSYHVVDFQQFKIFIDANALLFLIGTELDYHISDTSAKLVFNNPNAKHNCGCGKSFGV